MSKTKYQFITSVKETLKANNELWIMRTTVQNINREVTKVGRINGYLWMGIWNKNPFDSVGSK